MSFLGEPDPAEVPLNADGWPINPNFFDEPARHIYNALLSYARMGGCNCEFKLYVVNPFPEFYGMQLIHEATCMGSLRQAGIQGRN